MNTKRAEQLKEKCRKFRVLIIGRANAGKTTILKRVCDTTEDPEVYNKEGEMIDRSIIAESAGRGIHDIDDEMVFKSNPGFRFHDSRGFESGSVLELNKVTAFIERRSQARSLEDQLHAIWYCIPVDDSRPFTTVEERFFSTHGTGKVPVIALFTKFDALDNRAFAALRKENRSRMIAKRIAPNRATADFEKSHLPWFYDKPYPPRKHVCLRDMNKEGASCRELIRQTAASMDSEVLEQLLISTQQNNLGLCIEYALRRVALPMIGEIWKGSELLNDRRSIKQELKTMVIGVFSWFPHLVPLDPYRQAKTEAMKTMGYLDIGTVLMCPCYTLANS